MLNEETSAAFKLNDGRLLSYQIYGDLSLKNPLIYFHGLPGSSFEARILTSSAKKRGISVIAFDRPGIGDSTPHHGRSQISCADDVSQLMRHLKFDRAALLGVSGGTSFALATSALLKEKITSLSIVSGMYPPNLLKTMRGMAIFYRALFGVALYYPPAARLIVSLNGELLKHFPMLALGFMKNQLSGSDHELLSTPENISLFKKNAAAALRQGKAGAIQDFLLFFKDWGFSLNEYTGPVFIWHGTADYLLPDQMAKKLHAAIPQSALTLFPGEGHFMILKNQEAIIESAAETLVAQSDISGRGAAN